MAYFRIKSLRRRAWPEGAGSYAPGAALFNGGKSFSGIAARDYFAGNEKPIRPMQTRLFLRSARRRHCVAPMTMTSRIWR